MLQEDTMISIEIDTVKLIQISNIL